MPFFLMVLVVLGFQFQPFTKAIVDGVAAVVKWCVEVYEDFNR